MTREKATTAGKSQSDKFKDLARAVEADDDEAAFDATLRRMREANRRGERKPPAGQQED